jgi:hypothetical protein
LQHLNDPWSSTISVNRAKNIAGKVNPSDGLVIQKVEHTSTRRVNMGGSRFIFLAIDPLQYPDYDANVATKMLESTVSAFRQTNMTQQIVECYSYYCVQDLMCESGKFLRQNVGRSCTIHGLNWKAALYKRRCKDIDIR